MNYYKKLNIKNIEMKKIIYTLIISLLLLSCSSDYLDQVPDDKLTFEETFSKENTVQKYLANCYSQIPEKYDQRFVSKNSGPWTASSDEAEYVWGFHLGNYFNIGDWNASTQHVSTLWSNFYRGIRTSSTFIENVDSCQDCPESRIKQYKAEARVLRAYYYYNLMTIYGPVLLMPDQPISPDADLAALNLERNTIDEIVTYITNELDIAADELKDVSFINENTGRMSRPFALAIKEKALLFAASPLFNGNTDYANMKNLEGENLIPQSFDVNKWKLAADAAKAFIDEYVPGTYSLYKEYNTNGSYNPYLSTRNVMLVDWNKEIIYAHQEVNNTYQYDCTPYHAGADGKIKGAGGLSITQEMVDAYFTANGRSIDDPQSGYQDTGFSEFKAPYDDVARTTYNQWTNREPRFYTGVTYNGSLYLVRSFGDIITTTWKGGNSGKDAGGNDYSPTGYIVRKNVPLTEWGNSNRTFELLRLAEIYLDYAEALNEYDPGNSDILKYVNLIRERAGIPEYGSVDIPAPTGQDAIREAIRKERRVELAFESIRYFDARRWKIAEDVFGGPLHRLDIDTDVESEFYNVVTLETRVFEKKHYLWPIPQDELNSNTALIQNTGWFTE